MSKKRGWKKRNQKAKRKKTGEYTQARKEGKLKPMGMSFCSAHGPYTPDNLCPCYAEGETLDYDTMDLSKMENIWLKTCPIHGTFEPKSQGYCVCYNANGILKEDWDKDLYDSNGNLIEEKLYHAYQEKKEI